MIEFFIIIIMYTNGDYVVGVDYRTLEHCELAKKLKEYKKSKITDYILCKKVSINVDKSKTK